MAGGLAAQIAVMSATSRVTPYVVEVERGGAIRAVAPAVERYEPSDAQIAAELTRFIEHVRGVSIDPVVVKQSWLKAYDYATDRAALTLNDYARDNDPFAKIGRRSVSIEITSVVRASPTSFQLRWREKAFENGSLAGTESYTGVLTIVVKPPRDAATLKANPLGIYVNAINWSRELDLPNPLKPSGVAP
jgi:type IV secretion system protein TrbF